MKNILFVSTLVLLFSFVFTSCKKDEDEPSKDELIVGTWDCESIDDEPMTDWGFEYKIKFNSDKTGTETFTETGYSPITDDFDWSISGSTLTLDYGSDEMDITIKSLTKDAATLTIEIEGDPYDFKFSKR